MTHRNAHRRRRHPEDRRHRRPPTAGRVRKRLNSRTATLVSIVIAVLWTIPTFGLLVSSLRPEDEIKTTGWWTFFTNPQFTLENYQQVLFGAVGVLRAARRLLHQLAGRSPSRRCSSRWPSRRLAAYALAWINFRGRDWVYIAIFALQIVPLQMALVPLLQFFSTGVSLGGVT